MKQKNDKIKALIDADLRLGNDNEKAINHLLRREEYEELAVIKGVFEKHGKELPITRHEHYQRWCG